MLGISTSAGPRAYWNEWVKKTGLKAFELNLNSSYFPFEEKIIDSVKKDFKDFKISMHSSTECLFSKNGLIRESQQKTLLAEIEIAGMLGAQEIVFHAPRFDYVNIDKFLLEAVDFAKEKGVLLLLENPGKGRFSEPSVLNDFFIKHPEIKMCLDIGHLHVTNNNLEKEKRAVMDLKEHIVYLHLNDNSGLDDTHSAFGKGTLNWEELLNLIKNNCNIQKAIIETHSEEDALKARDLIRGIF